MPFLSTGGLLYNLKLKHWKLGGKTIKPINLSGFSSFIQRSVFIIYWGWWWWDKEDEEGVCLCVCVCVVAVYVWYLCADKILMDDFSDENLRFSKMETVLQMYFQNVLSF